MGGYAAIKIDFLIEVLVDESFFDLKRMATIYGGAAWKQAGSITSTSRQEVVLLEVVAYCY